MDLNVEIARNSFNSSGNLQIQTQNDYNYLPIQFKHVIPPEAGLRVLGEASLRVTRLH